MLEEKVHLNAYTANILEHVRELHIFRIRSETVKAAIILVSMSTLDDEVFENLHVMIINLQNVRDLRKSFS